MLILFLILLIILMAILYYELRVATSKLPKDVFRYYDFTQKKFIGRDVFIIKPLAHDDLYEPETNLNEKIILYIHGGSYVGELEKYHWHFFKDIINETKATIIVPDYPLAPEHTYLEAFNFMEPLYKEIIDNIGDKEFIGVIEVRNMMFCPDGNWQKYITMAPVIDGKETLLHIAENIRRFDSKILLVRNSAGNIAGILTTNNLFMHLFPKQSN